MDESDPNAAGVPPVDDPLVLRWDRRGRRVWASRAAAALDGALEGAPEVRAGLAALAGGAAEHALVVTVDGVRLTGHLLAQHDRRGRPAGAVGVFRAVPDDPTAALLPPLHAARRAAEQAVGALRAELIERERLAGAVAHDLRSPLAAAIAWVELLTRSSDAQVSGRARRILDVLDRAARTVDELVDTERLRRHTAGVLVRERVDLAQLAGEICDELLAARPDRDVSLHAAGDTVGSWDRTRVARVVGNLVGNALVHGGGTPVTVEVSGGSGDVRLAVHNGGAGLPGGEGTRLFEPFQRGSADGSGLGLGLYIAREIVRAHGGTLEAGSRDGRTTFVATLPREAAPLAAEARA